MRIRVVHALISIAAVGFTVAARIQEPIAPPHDARYVLSDGAIYIVGSDGLQGILTRLNELFARKHPGFKFRLLLKGSSYTAMGGITAGVSAFAPMDREAWPLEIRPFRQAYGYEPTAIRIARIGYSAPGRPRPPAIYVNSRNPLPGLTIEQVARIFTTGGAKGDLTQWSQLGAKGTRAGRAIHVYGPRDDGGYATGLRHTLMESRPFSRRYESLPTDADIIRAVADDPYGIALVGPHNAKDLLLTARMLPLAEKEGAAYSTAGYDDVMAGRYPLSPVLHIYVNRAPGKPLEPWIREYLRLALSSEGQEVIRLMSKSEGLFPLTREEAERELAKLD